MHENAPEIKKLARTTAAENTTAPKRTKVVINESDFDRLLNNIRKENLIGKKTPDIVALRNTTALLVVLFSILRPKDASLMNRDRCIWEDNQAIFTIGGDNRRGEGAARANASTAKNDKDNEGQRIRITKLDDPSICPYTYLKRYVAVTSEHKCNAVWLTKDGKPCAAPTISSGIKSIFKAAGLEVGKEGYLAKDLRSTMASRLVSRDHKELARSLGRWKDIASMDRGYIELTAKSSDLL